MPAKQFTVAIAVLCLGQVSGWAAPFGRVLPLGGQGSDLAIDEARGVLYVANFTANRVEVIDLATQSVRTSWNVAPNPYSLAISPNGRWLAVTHYGPREAPAVSRNSLTLVHLTTNQRQVLGLTAAPLGVAFGADGQALVLTATEFLLLDPETGAVRLLDTVQNVTANTLPRPPASFPPAIVAASMAASGDGRWIYGLTDTIRFRYDVVGRSLLSLGYVATPAFGPRAVSVDADGSRYTMGWGLFNRPGQLLAQFPDPSGLLGVGGHVLDRPRGRIYAQVPDSTAGANPANLPPPVLQVVDADNLAVLERLEIQEHLAGKGILDMGGRNAYLLSASGVMILPVGRLSQERRVRSDREDLVLRASSCDRGQLSAELLILDDSGQATRFRVSSSVPGIRFSPSQSGITPATIRVTAELSALPPGVDSLAAAIEIAAPDSVRIPRPVRLLLQRKDPDQRGTTVPVPGQLVDLLADPVRNRFYVLRQDTNQVLAFDAASHRQVAVWKTGNTPTQLAISFDRRYLLVGNDNSQVATVIDLETMLPDEPIVFPFGHYPRSLAASGRAILAATRVAGPQNKIDLVDFPTRRATELPTLGVWENNIHLNTRLAAAPNGASILAAQADGNVLLYDSSADTFTVSRRDVERLSGTYAASSFGQYVAGSNFLNSSLVPVRRLNTAVFGFDFVDEMGLRGMGPNMLERVDATGNGMRTTRIAEDHLAPVAGEGFTRTVAALANRAGVVTLTRSGVTILPWNYDAATVAPRLERVVNSADGSGGLAPSGLVSIFGSHLSPVNVATQEMPLPTALGESCLTVNGATVPMLFVSPSQINAQLPANLAGTVQFLLRTPGGVSDTFTTVVQPAAPAVFRIQPPGLDQPVAAVYNARNGLIATGSNPVRRGDRITIFLTGMGRTFPDVPAGSPAPSEPMAEPAIPPRVELGGVELTVETSAATPGTTGLYQIQARVSPSAPTGFDIPLVISQGPASTAVSVRVIP